MNVYTLHTHLIIISKLSDLPTVILPPHICMFSNYVFIYHFNVDSCIDQKKISQYNNQYFSQYTSMHIITISIYYHEYKSIDRSNIQSNPIEIVIELSNVYLHQKIQPLHVLHIQLS